MLGMSIMGVTFAVFTATPLMIGRNLGIRLRWGLETVRSVFSHGDTVTESVFRVNGPSDNAF
jgi:hypothetical protein